jgi:hypothetical protein
MLRPGRVITQPLAKESKIVSERTNDIDRFQERFDALRGRMIDLEAIAHAAADCTTQLPYLKQEERRVARRMYALVVATAKQAEGVLDEMDDLIKQIESGAFAGPDDGDGDSDGYGDGIEPVRSPPGSARAPGA